MPDKTFNEQPMITVVSDSIDPRIQRQMKSQLQSTLMTISEVTAELDNQKAMQDIKAQKDSVKDQTEFDEGNTEDSADPKPIEDNAGDNNENGNVAETNGGGEAEANGAEQAQPDSNTQSQQGDQSQGDPFQDSGDQSGTNSNAGGNDQAGGDNSQGDAAANVQPNQANGDQGNQQQNSDANQSNTQGNSDSNAQQGQAQNQAGANQNQQAQNPNQASQPQPTEGAGADNQGSGGEDPFTDDNVNFEAFAGILGFNYKSEDASQQTEDSEAPPIKNVVYIKGSDAGVDNRTSAVVATIEDPQNTVVILDLAEVAEVEAKLQFKNLAKQLQGRNIMVCDSVDQAVEYLNQVYDELTGKAE